MGRKERFVEIVREICEDDTHGYSQVNRNGDPDFDCSSLVYHAAREAGYAVPSWNGSTSSLKGDFERAGWTFRPCVGDLYEIPAGCILLIEGQHVETVVGYGEFGGASQDENGDIIGAQAGDQTGREILIRKPYWSGRWEWIGYPPDADEEDTVSQPRYRILSGRWYSEMIGLQDTSSCGDDYAGVMGTPMLGFACDYGRYRSAWSGGWLPWVTGYDTTDYYNGYAGKNGEPLTGLEIEDPSVHFQIHTIGGDWLEDRCTGNGETVDAVRCWRENG